jgi:hypothetical protein
MPPRFAADAMLGSLAKWLRLLGLDVVYLRGRPRPARPDRVLLTRRRDRPGQPELRGWAGVIRLNSDRVADQVVETMARAGVRPDDLDPLTRCGVCNGQLRPAPPSEVAGLVPPYVICTQSRFGVCRDCGRIYWPATHYRRIVDRLDQFPLESADRHSV